MQDGASITGKSGAEYRILRALGRPGLFGQAFLCQETGTQNEYVIKALRGDTTKETRARLSQEARTLERVATVEKNHRAHYAIRLIDESEESADEPFIVLERATGNNVLDDLIEQVSDWYKTPLDEQLTLDIAWHFAKALSYVHEAGLAYNDMKLDNLFWRSDKPDDPLRIIDWNVTTELREEPSELANDWARFGARLHHLYTGTPIGLDRNGSIVGQRPSGMLWDNIPYGIRALIEKALNKGYTTDTLLLDDLERERNQHQSNISELLSTARAADGRQADATEILAPLWRVEQYLKTDPSAQNDNLLKEIAELRQRGLTRQGKVSDENLQQIEKLLFSGERTLALEQFTRLHSRVGEADPQVRRWLWLARLANSRPDLYTQFRTILHDALNSFRREDYAAARATLNETLGSGEDLLGDLYYEASAYEAAQKQQYPSAIERLGQVTALRSTKDLLAFKEDLEQRQKMREQQEKEQQSAQRIYDEVVENSEQALQSEATSHYEEALTETKKAINSLADLYRNYEAYLPLIGEERKSLPSENSLIRNRERLEALIDLSKKQDSLKQHQTKPKLDSSVLEERVGYIEEMQSDITAFQDSLAEVQKMLSADQLQQARQALNLDELERFIADVQNLQRVSEEIDEYRTMPDEERARLNKERLTNLSNSLTKIHHSGITKLSLHDDEDTSLQVLIQEIQKRLARMDPVSHFEYEQLEKKVSELTANLQAVQDSVEGLKAQLTEQVAHVTVGLGKQATLQTNSQEFLTALNSRNYLGVVSTIERMVGDHREIAVKFLEKGLLLSFQRQIEDLNYANFAQPTAQLLSDDVVDRLEQLLQKLERPETDKVVIRLVQALDLPLKERSYQVLAILTESKQRDLPVDRNRLRDIATFYQDQHKKWQSSSDPDAEIAAMENYVTDLERKGIAWSLAKTLPYGESMWKQLIRLYRADFLVAKDDTRSKQERELAYQRYKRYKALRDGLEGKKKDEEFARLEEQVEELLFTQQLMAIVGEPDSFLNQRINQHVQEQLSPERIKQPNSPFNQSLEQRLNETLASMSKEPESVLSKAIDERIQAAKSSPRSPSRTSRSNIRQWVQWAAVVLVVLIGGSLSANVGGIRDRIFPPPTPTSPAVADNPPANPTGSGSTIIPTVEPTATLTVVPTATPTVEPTATPTAVPPTPEVPSEVSLADLSKSLDIPQITVTDANTATLVFPDNTSSVNISRSNSNAGWRIGPTAISEPLATYLAGVQDDLASQFSGTDTPNPTYSISLQHNESSVLTLTLNVKRVAGILNDDISEEDRLLDAASQPVPSLVPLRSEPISGTETIVRLPDQEVDALALSQDDVVVIIGTQDEWYRVQVVQANDPATNTATIPRQGWIRQRYIDGSADDEQQTSENGGE